MLREARSRRVATPPPKNFNTSSTCFGSHFSGSATTVNNPANNSSLVSDS